MNRSDRNHLRAFSLIELLVVIAIMAIVSAIIMVNWSSSRVARSLENAGKEVEAVVRSAQNFALSGAQTLPNTRPCAFRVSWGALTYDVLYRYRDGAGNCTQSSPLSSHTLSSGVVFSAVGQFEFGLPHALLGADQQIVLTRAGLGQSICIETNGQILTVAGVNCP